MMLRTLIISKDIEMYVMRNIRITLIFNLLFYNKYYFK